ncbi:hypothetical protein TNCV_3134971 [Trichonephila clavipes]|nr:hypothetical protein TNCV_3134971 [Trichonephila clavipes]
MLQSTNEPTESQGRLRKDASFMKRFRKCLDEGRPGNPLKVPGHHHCAREAGASDGPPTFKEHDFDVVYRTGRSYSDADASLREGIQWKRKRKHQTNF